MTVLRYRADIDGLRALAVLAVIVFHLNPKWLPGGFLGVDIFFVLSGYLITSIIHREMQAGTFSFAEFYKRRIKRIFPAFVFVLLLASPVAAYVFLHIDAVQYLKSAVASVFSAANLFFSRKGGYFDVSSGEKPLLHMWSLSVEEQFYLVFPLLLLLCFKKWPSKAGWLVPVLMAASLLSYFLPSFGLDRYFLPHIRAYELLIGALFAFVAPRDSNKAVSWLLLAVVAALLFVPHGVLPGGGYIERIIACSCVGLLILFGQYRTADKSDWVYRALSWRPVVWVGLISYSLYLWHWVILALVRYVYMDADLPLAVYGWCVLAMFALAWLSYRFVETPLRKIKRFSTKQMWLALAAYFALAVPLGAASVYIDKTSAAQVKLLHEDQLTCQDKIEAGKCGVGDLAKPVKTLFIGDSHAGQYGKFIDTVAKKEGWAADFISGNSCAVALGYRLPKDERAVWCNPVNEYLEQHYPQYDTVIFAERWFLQLPKADFLPKFEQTLRTLTAEGKTVYLFKDNPLSTYHVHRKYHLQKRGLDVGHISPQRVADAEKSEAANAQIQALLQKYPQVHWVDFTDLIPKDFMHDNLPVYRDYDHLNPYGSAWLGQEFIRTRTLLRH